MVEAGGKLGSLCPALDSDGRMVVGGIRLLSSATSLAVLAPLSQWSCRVKHLTRATPGGGSGSDVCFVLF